MTACERCSTKVDPKSFDLLDYCAECGKNLCGPCMKVGCCRSVPAKSGAAENADPDA